MNKIAVFMLMVMLVGTVFSTDSGITNVKKAMRILCGDLKALLPVAAMLMIVIAGVIYAAGQVMGAETRARANVWATAALTGALVAVLIYAVAPAVLDTIYGSPATGGIDPDDTSVCNST